MTLDVPEAQPADILPENIPLDIVYEDSDLLVVNKPKGMVVHPAPGHYSGTLVNALYVPLRRQPVGDKRGNSPGYSTQDRQGYKRTSYRSKERYRTQYTRRTDKGTQLYKGIYGGRSGVIKEDGRSMRLIAADTRSTARRCAFTTENSREAITHYFVEQTYRNNTLVRLRLETGRTHQIRAYGIYRASVTGDEVYGNGSPKWLCGQCLHAKKIGFIHPDGRYMEFDSELSDYFKKLLANLETQKTEI